MASKLRKSTNVSGTKEKKPARKSEVDVLIEQAINAEIAAASDIITLATSSTDKDEVVAYAGRLLSSLSEALVDTEELSKAELQAMRQTDEKSDVVKRQGLKSIKRLLSRKFGVKDVDDVVSKSAKQFPRDALTDAVREAVKLRNLRGANRNTYDILAKYKDHLAEEAIARAAIAERQKNAKSDEEVEAERQRSKAEMQARIKKYIDDARARTAIMTGGAYEEVTITVASSGEQSTITKNTSLATTAAPDTTNNTNTPSSTTTLPTVSATAASVKKTEQKVSAATATSRNRYDAMLDTDSSSESESADDTSSDSDSSSGSDDDGALDKAEAKDTRATSKTSVPSDTITDTAVTLLASMDDDEGSVDASTDALVDDDAVVNALNSIAADTDTASTSTSTSTADEDADAIDQDAAQSQEQAEDPRKAAAAARAARALALLPNWMREPRPIPAERTPLGSQLPFHLHPALLATLTGMGFTSLLPVQSVVLPALIAPASLALPSGSLHDALQPQHAPAIGPRDVCVCAPTGSGKTLAYLLPLVQAISSRRVPGVRALVVVPTRQLAQQVHSVAQSLCGAVGLRAVAVTGQNDIAADMAALRSGAHVHAHTITRKHAISAADTASASNTDNASTTTMLTSLSSTASEEDTALLDADVVVCTPGRLMDHLNTNPLFARSLRALEWLVLDECDKLMQASFGEWVHDVVSAIHSHSHTHGRGQDRYVRKMLFSATFTRSPAQLSALRLHSPVYWATAQTPEELARAVPLRQTLPAELRERLVVCEEAQKPLMLYLCIEYLAREARCRADIAAATTNTLTDAKSEPPTLLVFCNNAVKVHRVARMLEVLSLCRYTVREISSVHGHAHQAIKAFTQKQVQVLVCTDQAARGLDLPGLTYVVNYDVPRHSDVYVHRVGRTARGGASGTALSIATSAQFLPFFKALRAFTHTNIQHVKSSILKRGLAAVEALARVTTGYTSDHAKHAAAVAARVQAAKAAPSQGAAPGKTESGKNVPVAPTRVNRYADIVDSDDESSSSNSSSSDSGSDSDDDVGNAPTPTTATGNALERAVATTEAKLPPQALLPLPHHYALPLLSPLCGLHAQPPARRYAAALAALTLVLRAEDDGVIDPQLPLAHYAVLAVLAAAEHKVKNISSPSTGNTKSAKRGALETDVELDTTVTANVRALLAAVDTRVKASADVTSIAKAAGVSPRALSLLVCTKHADQTCTGACGGLNWRDVTGVTTDGIATLLATRESLRRGGVVEHDGEKANERERLGKAMYVLTKVIRVLHTTTESGAVDTEAEKKMVSGDGNDRSSGSSSDSDSDNDSDSDSDSSSGSSSSSDSDAAATHTKKSSTSMQNVEMHSKRGAKVAMNAYGFAKDRYDDSGSDSDSDSDSDNSGRAGTLASRPARVAPTANISNKGKQASKGRSSSSPSSSSSSSSSSSDSSSDEEENKRSMPKHTTTRPTVVRAPIERRDQKRSRKDVSSSSSSSSSESSESSSSSDDEAHAPPAKKVRPTTTTASAPAPAPTSTGSAGRGLMARRISRPLDEDTSVKVPVVSADDDVLGLLGGLKKAKKETLRIADVSMYANKRW